MNALDQTSSRLALVVLVACAGCGSDDDPGATGTGASTASSASSAGGASSESASSTASASTGGAGGRGGAGGGAPLTDNGFVAWTGVYDGGTTNVLVANFIAAAGERCATEHVGACWTIDCTKMGAAPLGVSAGDVELYDGKVALLTSSPTSEGVYPVKAAPGALWQPGDAIGIRAEGAELGAFDVALVAPSTVSILSPKPGMNGKVPTPTDADLVVTWTPSSGTVTVAESQVMGGADLRDSTRFICEFDGGAGSGTVPKAVMAVLDPSFAGATNLNIGGSVTKDVMVGAYALHVYAIDAETLDSDPATTQ